MPTGRMPVPHHPQDRQYRQSPKPSHAKLLNPKFQILNLKRAVEHADFEQSPVNIGFR